MELIIHVLLWLYNTVQDAYMTEHVKLPTRRCRQTPSVLEFIFTADPNTISDLLHLPPLGYSRVIMKF